MKYELPDDLHICLIITVPVLFRKLHEASQTLVEMLVQKVNIIWADKLRGYDNEEAAW